MKTLATCRSPATVYGNGTGGLKLSYLSVFDVEAVCFPAYFAGSASNDFLQLEEQK